MKISKEIIEIVKLMASQYTKGFSYTEEQIKNCIRITDGNSINDTQYDIEGELSTSPIYGAYVVGELSHYTMTSKFKIFFKKNY